MAKLNLIAEKVSSQEGRELDLEMFLEWVLCPDLFLGSLNDIRGHYQASLQSRL